MMRVVPPKAAARVPVSKSSEVVVPPNGNVQMRVRVDAAGDDQLAGGVDALVGFDREVLADQGHLRAVDEDVGDDSHRPR